MTKLEEFNSAARIAESVRRIARSTIFDVYQPPREATIDSLDFTNSTVTLEYPGDTETFALALPAGVVPADTTATVRVTGPQGSRYVDEIRGSVQFRSSTATATTQNVYLRHQSAADANGELFADLVRGTSTRIGSITQVSTTGVAYNTTSDPWFKGNVTDFNDDAALAVLMQLRPVRYQWKLDDTGTYDKDAAPAGATEIGFLADEVQPVAPWAVVDRSGEYGEEGFAPMGLDYGRLTPILVGAIQALVARVEYLEAA